MCNGFYDKLTVIDLSPHRLLKTQQTHNPETSLDTGEVEHAQKSTNWIPAGAEMTEPGRFSLEALAIQAALPMIPGDSANKVVGGVRRR